MSTVAVFELYVTHTEDFVFVWQLKFSESDNAADRHLLVEMLMVLETRAVW